MLLIENTWIVAYPWSFDHENNFFPGKFDKPQNL